ncbi:Uncharacterised protein [Mycobacteroides abscessus subsp. abscessus]|nr:Uncharacterised protein [Mycobacteroides abscessus subsp. abscessus]
MFAPTKCHHTSTAPTSASSGRGFHQPSGMKRLCLRPSAVSRVCSATNEIAVSRTPRIIAMNLATVGELLYRVSTVAESFRPSGAGPDRSVKMPTICGRKS